MCTSDTSVAMKIGLALQAGVWYQKCYDPCCRSYKSELMPIPPEVVRQVWMPVGKLHTCVQLQTLDQTNLFMQDMRLDMQI